MRKKSNVFLVLLLALLMSFAAALPVFAAGSPAKVSNLKVTLAADTHIDLSWSKANNATKYEVQYRVSSSNSWKSKKTSAVKASINNLTPNKEYYFKVRGLNGSSKGAFSKTVKQKTFLSPAPIDYESIFASYRDRREISLKWKAAENAKSYEIWAKELNDSGPADVQNSTYDENYNSLPEYTSVIMMRPNTWYEFKIRSVNYKTGKFPAVKSDWSDSFYASTLKGDRVITGVAENGIKKYELNDTFVINEDEVLIPKGTYYVWDPSDPYYNTDVLKVNSITFPANFTNDIMRDCDNFDQALDGMTFAIGDNFDGQPIKSISIYPYIEYEPTGYFEVVFNLGGGYAPSIIW